MPHVVTTPTFEGPLDLLLHLVNTHEVDILDVPLSPIVDGFVAIVRERAATGQNVEELSEFLLLAAILLELKSHQLLPGREQGEPDEEFLGWEERDVLLARLIEMRTYASLADAFVSLFERAARSHPRLAGVNPGFVINPPDLLAGVSPHQLAEAYLKGIEEKPVPTVGLHHVTVDAVTVAETVVALADRLPALGKMNFRQLVAGLTARIEIIVHFLALLELCKLGYVDLGQGSTFGELEIEWVGQSNRLELGLVDVYEG